MPCKLVDTYHSFEGTCCCHLQITRFIWDDHEYKGVMRAVPLLRRLAASLSSRRPGFDPGWVHVGFVVNKVTLGQGFLEYFGFPLSVSFHRCSVTRKRAKNSSHHHLVHHRVAQEALRLWCVRSVCCGALLHYRKRGGNDVGGSLLLGKVMPWT
jgi:hypothetical protein